MHDIPFGAQTLLFQMPSGMRQDSSTFVTDVSVGLLMQP